VQGATVWVQQLTAANTPATQHASSIFAFFNLPLATIEIALFDRVRPRQLVAEDRTARYIYGLRTWTEVISRGSRWIFI
jgi:hypothetical protein